MKSFRLALVMLLAGFSAAASGCRTAGVGDLTRRDLFPNHRGDSAAELLADHNANAERVQSVEARPWINVANRTRMAGVNGKLAMERPRNFKLDISAGPLGQEVADIGSNEREFWFWVKDSPEKAVFYCNYDESGSSPLPSAFQPDWIVEALGLRVFTSTEAAAIQVVPGRDPGTVVLIQKQRSGKADTVIKETVLAESTRRIREHRVYASDHKTLLARASISEYKDYPLPAGSEGAEKTVYLPLKFKLEWPQEKMALEVGLRDVKVNTTFTQARRELLFVEPVMAGIGREDLAKRSALASDPTSIRETMPAPPRVKLGEPTASAADAARKPLQAQITLGDDLPPAYARGVEEVVGPPIPTIAEPHPETVQARSGWRNSFAASIER
jgi:hypothetical protein